MKIIMVLIHKNLPISPQTTKNTIEKTKKPKTKRPSRLLGLITPEEKSAKELLKEFIFKIEQEVTSKEKETKEKIRKKLVVHKDASPELSFMLTEPSLLNATKAANKKLTKTKEESKTISRNLYLLYSE
ncbi:uncharacterized protein VNE69_09163 [Vairimorpha necatrix]|uniref:Uncharacterized protein n=1 Tax=Vairimorpha necatrix TaxID=6039 RepID=A0AAX4JFN4_9MICR